MESNIKVLYCEIRIWRKMKFEEAIENLFIRHRDVEEDEILKNKNKNVYCKIETKISF